MIADMVSNRSKEKLAVNTGQHSLPVLPRSSRRDSALWVEAAAVIGIMAYAGLSGIAAWL